MSYLFPVRHQEALNRHWGWFFLWGLALVILGICAVSLATLTTLISIIALGVLIFIAGIVIILDSLKFWWGRWDGFFFHLIVGIVYVIVGVMLFRNPVMASLSLTLLLGIFYIAIGALRIIYALWFRMTAFGWIFFNGLIALLLGILIVANWPEASLFIIGLFVGIDLFFAGLAYIALGLSARSLR